MKFNQGSVSRLLSAFRVFKNNGFQDKAVLCLELAKEQKLEDFERSSVLCLLWVNCKFFDEEKYKNYCNECANFIVERPHLLSRPEFSITLKECIMIFQKERFLKSGIITAYNSLSMYVDEKNVYEFCSIAGFLSRTLVDFHQYELSLSVIDTLTSFLKEKDICSFALKYERMILEILRKDSYAASMEYLNMEKEYTMSALDCYKPLIRLLHSLGKAYFLQRETCDFLGLDDCMKNLKSFIHVDTRKRLAKYLSLLSILRSLLNGKSDETKLLLNQYASKYLSFKIQCDVLSVTIDINQIKAIIASELEMICS